MSYVCACVGCGRPLVLHAASLQHPLVRVVSCVSGNYGQVGPTERCTGPLGVLPAQNRQTAAAVAVTSALFNSWGRHLHQREGAARSAVGRESSMLTSAGGCEGCAHMGNAALRWHNDRAHAANAAPPACGRAFGSCAASVLCVLCKSASSSARPLCCIPFIHPRCCMCVSILVVWQCHICYWCCACACAQLQAPCLQP